MKTSQARERKKKFKVSQKKAEPPRGDENFLLFMDSPRRTRRSGKKGGPEVESKCLKDWKGTQS